MLQTWRRAPRRSFWPTWGTRRTTAAPVELATLRYGFLPTRFRHRGELHRVVRIERIWEEQARHSLPDRRHFRVACADGGQCTLVQELRAGTWIVIW